MAGVAIALPGSAESGVHGRAGPALRSSLKRQVSKNMIGHAGVWGQMGHLPSAKLLAGTGRGRTGDDGYLVRLVRKHPLTLAP